jgi:hypothetical protein
MSRHPKHLWLFAHLLTVAVNVQVATSVWPTPRIWTEGSSATDFFREVQTGLRPTYPPIELVLEAVSQGDRSWYKAERFPSASVKVKNEWSCTSAPPVTHT